MGLHESTVNYQNLIRDLAEMYPFEEAQVVVVELVANSLDAKATRISISYDTQSKILTVIDNGKGMSADQFDDYHDFAAGLKTRGTGIGFAGVGAKISFNVADRVVTETRGESFSGGSNWYLQSKKKLLWEDIRPSHLKGHGTRVEVHFRRDRVPSYASTEDLVDLLQHHYLPLFDKTFLDLYAKLKYYSTGLRFTINGREINPDRIPQAMGLENIKEFKPTRAGKKTGFGFFGVAPGEYPLGRDCCGVLLCTHGKVIKADFLAQFPGGLGPRILGVVEVPEFIHFLTTSKTDFVRARGTYKQFEGLYHPIREEFKTWLVSLGVEPLELPRGDEAARLERELKRLLEDVPELREFFGFRSKKSVLSEGENGTVRADVHEGVEVTFPEGVGEGGGEAGPLEPGDQPGETVIENTESGSKKANPISRTGRRGPKISFASVPDRVDLAWVDGDSVIINSGHPSYIKAESNLFAKRVLCFFAIGSAIQRVMADPDSSQDLAFVDRFMAAWGRK